MRYAVLSDIHGNLPALEAVLADIQTQGGVDRYWCLGDVVGYGPDANECIEMLKGLDHRCIAGNHDWGSIGRIDTTLFNRDAAWAVQWTDKHLTPANRRYLENLPEMLVEDHVTLVHGTPRSPIWEYMMSLAIVRESFGLVSTHLCLVGHSHIPVLFEEAPSPGELPTVGTYEAGVPLSLTGARRIINPGSVGQPRDGNPDASYGILDTEAQTWTWRRVPYPITQVQERMRRLGFPPRLISRLSYGW
jgi:predicted phosphodiesterase